MSGIDDIRAKFQAFERGQLQTVRRAMDASGKAAAQYAQANHPWQNQSGDAERGLQWVPLHSENPLDGARGALTNQAPHGKYLEINNGSRFEIIQSTVAHFGPDFPARLRGKG